MNTMNPVAYGLIVAVIGIAVVFVGLTILVFFVWLMGQLFRAITKAKEEKAKKAAEAAAAAAPAPAPVVEQPVVEESAVVDDSELIAVIAAAIAAFDNSGKRLVVRKVRRVPGWKDAARSEQIYHF
ncbi:MAG: OadG family protein [Aristaeellaceae bacterium]|nr:OadG family protein [Eubacteriales bacterium]